MNTYSISVYSEEALEVSDGSYIEFFKNGVK